MPDDLAPSPRTAPATAAPSLEMRFTRAYAAPAGVLLRAWTEPGELATWWGPHWFAARADAPPAPGRTPVSPRPDARIVVERIASPGLRVILELEARAGSTTLGLRLVFPSVGACARARMHSTGFIREHLERLERHLSIQPTTP